MDDLISETNPAPWQQRARESWSAATKLALEKPHLPMSAASRLYYSVLQGATAYVLRTSPETRIPRDHGKFKSELLSSNDDLISELGDLLQETYALRRKADYADDDVTVADVTKQLALCKPALVTIKVCKDQ